MVAGVTSGGWCYEWWLVLRVFAGVTGGRWCYNLVSIVEFV